MKKKQKETTATETTEETPAYHVGDVLVSDNQKVKQPVLIYAEEDGEFKLCDEQRHALASTFTAQVLAEYNYSVSANVSLDGITIKAPKKRVEFIETTDKATGATVVTPEVLDNASDASEAPAVPQTPSEVPATVPAKLPKIKRGKAEAKTPAVVAAVNEAGGKVTLTSDPSESDTSGMPLPSDKDAFLNDVTPKSEDADAIANAILGATEYNQMALPDLKAELLQRFPNINASGGRKPEIVTVLASGVLPAHWACGQSTAKLHGKAGRVERKAPDSERVIVQLSAYGSVLAALCNDGTVWQLCDGWQILPSIPQDKG